MKSYTDLEQSKKLAEILPLESADMGWNVFVDDTTRILPINDWDLVKDGSGNVKFYHAWSLAALLGVLPNNEHITTTFSRGGWKIEPVEYIDKWFCEYEDGVGEDSPCNGFTVSADNPVDACVTMIEKLHELRLLRH